MVSMTSPLFICYLQHVLFTHLDSSIITFNFFFYFFCVSSYIMVPRSGGIFPFFLPCESFFTDLRLIIYLTMTFSTCTDTFVHSWSLWSFGNDVDLHFTVPFPRHFVVYHPWHGYPYVNRMSSTSEFISLGSTGLIYELFLIWYPYF